MDRKLAEKIYDQLSDCLGDGYKIMLMGIHNSPDCIVEVRYNSESDSIAKIPIEVCALCANHLVVPQIKRRLGEKTTFIISLT
jgi:hypothetical protein